MPPTYLTVPIKVRTLAQACDDVRAAHAGGAEMVEFRLDDLPDPTPDQVRPLIDAAHALHLPCIATCRPGWEGGGYDGPEDHRRRILAAADHAGADYVDIELAAFQREPFPLHHAGLILSSHDFDRVPSDADDRLRTLRTLRPDVGKIAWQVRRVNEIFPLLDALHDADSPTIALAMGPRGLASRLLAKKLGAFLTFAALDAFSETAAGQPTLAALKTLYRWDRLGARTRVFGVIGCPLGHSLSPLLHNRMFDATGCDGLYLPFEIDPEPAEFAAFLDNVRARPWLDAGGFSVTIPHKHHALNYIKAQGGVLDPLAEKIGAVNTIVLGPDGALRGANTDYAGAMTAICETLNVAQNDLRRLPVAVIGAGGVAHALVAGLTDAGADVTIYNRTLDKAQRLADHFHCRCAPLDRLRPLDARLLVNCTSIGMFPHVEASAVPADLLRPDMTVFDSVYNPVDTLLLRQARQAGARTIDGLAMFVNQAALQFEMFTGQTPPRPLMRDCLLHALESR